MDKHAMVLLGEDSLDRTEAGASEGDKTGRGVECVLVAGVVVEERVHAPGRGGRKGEREVEW